MNFIIPLGTFEIAWAGSLTMFLAELSGLLAAAMSDSLKLVRAGDILEPGDRVDFF